MIKNNFRILKKTHANLQTIAKAPVKFQKDWPKTVGGVEGTRYLLKIRNHALRKAENNVPPLFFEKAGDKNLLLLSYKCQVGGEPTNGKRFKKKKSKNYQDWYS